MKFAHRAPVSVTSLAGVSPLPTHAQTASLDVRK